MIYIIRNADRTIKTFMERGDDCVLQPGEALEMANQTFIEYASRLRLSVNGRSCEMVQAAAGETVTVLVQVPGRENIGLAVNGATVNVPLTNEVGELAVTNTTPAQILIAPADRANFCAAGEAVIGVEFK